MKKLNKISLSLIMMLSFLFNLIPVTTANAAAVTNLVTAARTSSESTLYVGGNQESEINLKVKGTSQSVVIPNDIMLLLDKSGSMNHDNRFDTMKKAASQFIDLVDTSKHEVGIVDYSDVDRTSTKSLTTDKSDLKNYISKMWYSGNTYTNHAIRSAISEFKANGRKDAKPVIVLLTDGEATETEDALKAAEEAKEAGITFYTIALLAPNADINASAPNELLKQMATSESHHHFVLGSDKLSDVYNAIAKEIGVASAYDVEITETVSPEFEIVAGSYDDNIPRPTVEGNTLKWNIKELKSGDLNLSYKIKLKDGVKAGKYKVANPATITYKDYSGKEDTYNIQVTYIYVNEKQDYPVPELLYGGIRGDYPTIPPLKVDRIVKRGESYLYSDKSLGNYWLRGSNLEPCNINIYDENENMLVKIEPKSKTKSELRFILPENLEIGNYKISVVNPDGEESKKIDLEIVASKDSVPDLAYISTNGTFNQRVEEITKNRSVFVYLHGINFESGSRMNLYDQNENLVLQQDYKEFFDEKKTRFPLTSSLEAGNYKISVTNPNGNESNKIGLKIMDPKTDDLAPQLSYLSSGWTEATKINTIIENDSYAIYLQGKNFKSPTLVNVYDRDDNIIEQYATSNFYSSSKIRSTWKGTKSGEYKIAVVNPDGQESNKVDLEIVSK